MIVHVAGEGEDFLPVLEEVEERILVCPGVAVRRDDGNVHKQDDEVVVGHVGKIVLEPTKLALGDVSAVALAFAEPLDAVEGDEVDLAMIP